MGALLSACQVCMTLLLLVLMHEIMFVALFRISNAQIHFQQISFITRSTYSYAFFHYTSSASSHYGNMADRRIQMHIGYCLIKYDMIDENARKYKAHSLCFKAILRTLDIGWCWNTFPAAMSIAMQTIMKRKNYLCQKCNVNVQLKFI